MALPLKILNRLHLGRDLAASAQPSDPERLAWVYVYPIPDPPHSYFLWAWGGEGRLVAANGESPIKGFLVRHVEIDAKVVDQFMNNLRDDLGSLDIDHRFVAANEGELELALRRLLPDFTTPHVPTSVGYDFELGPDLIGAIGAQHGDEYP